MRALSLRLHLRLFRRRLAIIKGLYFSLSHTTITRKWRHFNMFRWRIIYFPVFNIMTYAALSRRSLVTSLRVLHLIVYLIVYITLKPQCNWKVVRSWHVIHAENAWTLDLYWYNILYLHTLLFHFSKFNKFPKIYIYICIWVYYSVIFTIVKCDTFTGDWHV